MKKSRVFLVYFPVILVSCQVAVNVMSFLFKDAYLAAGFYLNTFFGTNIFFAIFLVIFTHSFDFCRVSRWASIAELLFAVNFMAVKEDNFYNIMFQIIVGCVALLLTFKHYIKKFPMCNYSLAIRFYRYVMREKSCSKGYVKMEEFLNQHPNNKIHGRAS